MDRLISEKKAIEAINDYWGEMETPTIDGYINAIKAIPSAEPKTGHREYNDIYDHYLCGNCKTVVMDYDNFCPNCGARMVEEQESDEISDRNLKMWEEIYAEEKRRTERSDKE